MKHWQLIALTLLLAAVTGCNRDADKGLNADKDRPKPADKVEVKK